jgi:hypothetical protein
VSRKAVASAILGIAGLPFCPAAPIAVYLGWKALSDVKASGGELQGSGWALFGIVLGAIGTAFLAFVTLIAVIYLYGWLTGQYP